MLRKTCSGLRHGSRGRSRRRERRDAPVAGGDLVDEHHLVSVGRLVAVDERVADLAVGIAALGLEHDGLGGEVVAKCVHGGAGIAPERPRARGEEGVAVCFDATFVFPRVFLRWARVACAPGVINYTAFGIMSKFLISNNELAVNALGLPGHRVTDPPNRVLILVLKSHVCYRSPGLVP
jgi:hypothetical protein